MNARHPQSHNNPGDNDGGWQRVTRGKKEKSAAHAVPPPFSSPSSSSSSSSSSSVFTSSSSSSSFLLEQQLQTLTDERRLAEEQLKKVNEAVTAAFAFYFDIWRNDPDNHGKQLDALMNTIQQHQEEKRLLEQHIQLLCQQVDLLQLQVQSLRSDFTKLLTEKKEVEDRLITAEVIYRFKKQVISVVFKDISVDDMDQYYIGMQWYAIVNGTLDKVQTHQLTQQLNKINMSDVSSLKKFFQRFTSERTEYVHLQHQPGDLQSDQVLKIVTAEVQRAHQKNQQKKDWQGKLDKDLMVFTKIFEQLPNPPFS